MEAKKYQWKVRGLHKVDPELAAKELERIDAVYGKLTSETLLHAAEPLDSLFHPLFEWNNDAAATKYRLTQATSIINNVTVIVVSDGEARQVSVYEVVKSNIGQVYKSIYTMNPDEIEQVKMRTIRELIAMRKKLSFFELFDPAVSLISETITTISSIHDNEILKPKKKTV